MIELQQNVPHQPHVRTATNSLQIIKAAYDQQNGIDSYKQAVKALIAVQFVQYDQCYSQYDKNQHDYARIAQCLRSVKNFEFDLKTYQLRTCNSSVPESSVSSVNGATGK